MVFSRVVPLIAVFALLVFSAGAARSAEYTIVINHMELEQIAETMRVGDVVTFDNQSDMAHNIYVTYADGSVDNLDTQIPGRRRTITLRAAGPAIIRCWIHPIIRADVEILEEAKPSER